jgi:hypothetical protein
MRGIGSMFREFDRSPGMSTGRRSRMSDTGRIPPKTRLKILYELEHAIRTHERTRILGMIEGRSRSEDLKGWADIITVHHNALRQDRISQEVLDLLPGEKEEGG